MDRMKLSTAQEDASSLFLSLLIILYCNCKTYALSPQQGNRKLNCWGYFVGNKQQDQSIHMHKDQSARANHIRQQSGVEILFPATKIDNIVVDACSSDIQINDSFCFYFPQLKKIFYLHLKKIQLQTTLEDFARQLLNKNISIFPKDLNPHNYSLSFTDLKTRQIVTPALKLKQKQCEKVAIHFNGQLPEVKVHCETFVILRTKIDQNCVIQYEEFRDFNVGDLLMYKKIGESQVAGVIIGQKIIRLYQPLSQAQLQPGKYAAYPLFSFQIFYHDMHQAYSRLESDNFDLQSLTFIGQEALQRSYKRFHSQNISKISHMAILYLTSSFFNPKIQKKYINNHFNGKLMRRGEIDLKDKETQEMCAMIEAVQSLPLDDNFPIFFVEEAADHEEDVFRIGEIVRIQTFSPATNREDNLMLAQQKHYYLYEIDHLTARYVSLYTGGQNGHTHIILPYTDYRVLSFRIEGKKMTRIRMTEMPLPRRIDTNLIFWISRDYESARIVHKNRVKGKNEVLLMKDNEIFGAWLQKYGKITLMRKCCVVWDCDREEESLVTLELGLKYFGSQAKIFIYNENPKNFMSRIQENYQVGANVRVTSKEANIEQFILSYMKDSKPEERDCECNKCQIF